VTFLYATGILVRTGVRGATSVRARWPDADAAAWQTVAGISAHSVQFHPWTSFLTTNTSSMHKGSFAHMPIGHLTNVTSSSRPRTNRMSHSSFTCILRLLAPRESLPLRKKRRGWHLLPVGICSPFRWLRDRCWHAASVDCARSGWPDMSPLRVAIQASAGCHFGWSGITAVELSCSCCCQRKQQILRSRNRRQRSGDAERCAAFSLLCGSHASGGLMCARSAWPGGLRMCVVRNSDLVFACADRCRSLAWLLVLFVRRSFLPCPLHGGCPPFSSKPTQWRSNNNNKRVWQQAKPR